MKKQDIINKTIKMVQHNAYIARVCDELRILDFDAEMMKYERDVASGKAFAGLEILSFITGESNDEIYEKAVGTAILDIKEANYNIVKLLNLAGRDGERYYRIVKN